MKKEIRFSSVIDTKEFDRAVEQMQKKLQSVYQASDRSRSQLEVKTAVSRAGLGPAPTTGDKVRADQDDRKTRREMDQFIKEQVKNQELLSKSIAKQLEQKKELSKLAKEDVKAQEKVLELEKQIATNREKMKLSEEQTMNALNRRQMPGFNGSGGFGGALQRGAAAYQGAGVGGAGFLGQMGAGIKGFGRGLAGMGGSALALGGLGIAGTLAAAGSDFLYQRATAPREVLNAQATARGVYGQNVTDMFSGNGFERAFFSKENARSLKDARLEIDRTKTSDNLSSGGRAIGYGLAGAAIGSMILPGIGTAIGGGLGSAYGGFTGENGLYARMTGTYQNRKESEAATIYQQNLEARKNLDPLKRAAVNRYQQEIMPNLAAQRSSGMSDSEMQDLLLQGASSGFTTDMTRQSMQGILGAGGSTRTARESATFTNRLQRNFDLTNASSAMGRISGLTSSSGQADASMVRVLAEAVSLGLDDSQFAEEQRRFVDSTTQVIGRSGALNENQMGVASNFSKFVAGREMYQVEGARTAYDVTQRLSGESGGARGAIQAAAIMRDKDLSKLNRDERNMLAQLTDEQLETGGPMVEGMAASAGLSKDEFVKKAKALKQGANSTRADIDKQRNILRKLKAEGKTGTDDYKKATSKYLTGMGYDVGEIAKMKPAELESFMKGNVFGDEGPSQEKIQQNELDVLARSEKGPERAGDKFIAGQAAGDAAFIETMKNFSSEVNTANDNLIKFSEEIVKVAGILRTINEKDSEGISKYSKKMGALYESISGPQGKALTQEKGAPPSGND